MGTKEKGARCESLVCEHLASQGYRILERNFRCPYGELDIISEKDGVLCVTEVKSLTPRWSGDEIAHMVPKGKLMKMRRTLSHYLASNKVEGFHSIRFDVAAVTDGRVEYYCGDE